MIFNSSHLVIDRGIDDYSRFIESVDGGVTVHVLIVRHWPNTKEVEFDARPADRNHEPIFADWDHPELRAIGYNCAQPEPVIDWLLEHAETDDQRKLVAELEKLIGAPRG